MDRLFTPGQIAYYAGWLFRAKVGSRRPLVNTMIIDYRCNLKCKHCQIAGNLHKVSGPLGMDYDTAVREMKYFYDAGARILFLEGGEPSMWSDGDRRLPDLIRAGKEIGYFVTGYTTNATEELCEESDVISVSLDGPRELHDQIRGEGVFDQMMRNLESTRHGNIFANMVVTKMNLDAVKETVEVVSESEQISGIMLNFLTPPPANLVPDPQEKKSVIDLALGLKKDGYPILNTDRALKDLLIEDFEGLCPTWLSAFVMPDGTRLYGCPMRGTESCRKCGFDAVREYRLIVRTNYQTITQMSRRFALSSQR